MDTIVMTTGNRSGSVLPIARRFWGDVSPEAGLFHADKSTGAFVPERRGST